MQNLKYKALSIAMAVMTAASPVLSSYTAYASDNVADNIVVNDDGTVSQTFNLEDNNDDSSEEKETKFLFLNLKTTGGKAIISEGKDQEQTIRLDEKQDGSEYIDVMTRTVCLSQARMQQRMLTCTYTKRKLTIS